MCQLAAYLVWKPGLIQKILHTTWIKLSDHFKVDFSPWLICPLENTIAHGACSHTPTVHTQVSYKCAWAFIYSHLHIYRQEGKTALLVKLPHIHLYLTRHRKCLSHCFSLTFFIFPTPADLHQYLWHPAPGASGQQPNPVRLAVLLRGHLLHGGLWRCHPPNLALTAPGGHHDLCGTHCASHPGEKKQW